MKKLLIIGMAIALITVSVPGYTQEVKSRYGDVYPESVANQPAPLLPNSTALDQRDYGIDLFIAGMILNVAVGPTVAALGPVIGIAAVAGGDLGTGIVTTLLLPATGAIVSTVGFGMWVAGAVYWGTGNATLSQGVVINKDPENEVLLALDTNINGLGFKIKY